MKNDLIKIVLVVMACGFMSPALRAQPGKLLESGNKTETRVTTGNQLLELGGVGESDSDEQPRATTLRPKGAGADIYKKSAPAIVMVQTEFGHGTGFFISADGWLVTNHHVIAEAEFDTELKARVAMIFMGEIGESGWMESPHPVGKAVIYNSSESQDLALLKLAELPKGMSAVPYLELAGNLPGPGMECVAIGHPGIGAMWSVRTGQVTGAGNRTSSDIAVLAGLSKAEQEEYEKLKKEAGDRIEIFQTNLDIHPGDSGGPLLDSKGEVIGVTFAFRSDYETSLSLHIHQSELKSFLDRKSDTPLVIPPNPYDNNDLVHYLIDVDEDGIDDAYVGIYEDSTSGSEELLWFAILPEMKKSSEAEERLPFFSIYALPRLTVSYDSNEDGEFDLILRDEDGDGEIETRYGLRKGEWKISKASAPFLSSKFLKSPSSQDRFSKWLLDVEGMIADWQALYE